MSVCPNCGAFSNGGKFCESCGTPLPAEQNVQPAQQYQPQPQPVQPVQPIPVQPVYPQPVQPAYQLPGYQQPYMQPGQVYQPQPAYTPVKKQSTNGACIAGFILGLVGLFTFGIPSLIGVIVSTIGVIVAFAKKQKGKVLGIIGFVLSLLMVVGWILLIENSDKIGEALNSSGEGTSFEEWLFDDSYEDKIAIISETEWVEKSNGSRIVFEADNSFTYYDDYRDLNNNYYSGTYEVYIGFEGINIIDERYSHFGYTSDDICDKIDNERGVDGVKDFVTLIFHNDGYWVDGNNAHDLKWDTVYIGYFDKNNLIMDLTYLEDGKAYTFVSWDNFDESSIVMPETTPSETEHSEYYWGSVLVGGVELYQGEWSGCDEEDEMGYYYLEKIQAYNEETETRIQLSVVSGQYYEPSVAEEMAESFKETMEEYDYEVSEVEETTLGGYTAYVVTAQYDDGQYFTAWYFVDKDLRVHYITVLYYDSDSVSYEMVRDTYTYEH